ncbi:MAG: hypothetical protein IJ551_00660 [Prevotella sp.]|nr:hypothetical protein [Prevotella sp.]
MMMTFRKILFSTLAAVALCSCNSDVETDELHYAYYNRPVDRVHVYKNVVGGMVGVTIIDSDNFYAYENGDADMEQQLDSYLHSKAKRAKAVMPTRRAADYAYVEVIDYTAEACESIRFTLYDSHDVMLADLTNEARFYQVGDDLFLFNSDKELLGRVEEGSTLVDYLAKRPMMFVRALFTFPGLDTSLLQDGNHVKVEVRLANGTVLTADTNDTQE